MAGNEEVDIPGTGAVFTFGRSRFADNVPSHFFIRNDPVIEIACGDEHTAVVCQKGRVFMFGNNDYGQLGLGHRNVVTKPSCVKSLKPEKATHVACGRAHTIVGTESGQVWAWGSNSDGQLGVGDSIDRAVPTQLLDYAGDAVCQLSAGCLHSAALTESGRVFVWGSNADGQLGLDNDHETVPFPQLLPFSHNVVHISCGYYHTAMVTAEGELYTCGEGEHGKLGLPDSVAGASTPSRVLLGEPLAAVACGGTHTLALARSGKVFAFGNNSHGQLGLGSEVNQSILPTPVDSLADYNVASVSCGENHSTFITEEGDLYVCGEGRYGKLCNEDIEEKTITIPTRAQRFSDYIVQKAACGGCHSMILAHLFEERSERQRDHSLTLSPIFTNEERKYSRMSQLSPAVVVNNNAARSECGDETSTRVERGSIQSMDVNGNDDALSATAADEDSLSNETERLDNDFQEDLKEADEIEEMLADKDENEEDEKDNDDVAVEPEEKKQGRVARFFSAFRRKKPASASAASAASAASGVAEADADEAKSRSQSGQSNSRDAPDEKKSKTCILL